MCHWKMLTIGETGCMLCTIFVNLQNNCKIQKAYLYKNYIVLFLLYCIIFFVEFLYDYLILKVQINIYADIILWVSILVRNFKQQYPNSNICICLI